MASALLVKLTLLAAIIGIAYSVGIYEQCAGEGYGTFPCNAGMGCFRRNKWFSSCQYSCPRNIGWECESYIAPTPAPTIAAGWDQCGGEGWVGATVCAAGFACYARSVYFSQCRPVYDCPAGWACGVFVGSTTVAGPVILPAYAKCNDVANAVCPTGTACFQSSALYSECRPNCPAGWACSVLVESTTVAGPVTLPAYAQCNDVANAVCPAGTACFRNNALYSECRPNCPATWACETDVTGSDGQCGGEGYVGLTRCPEGFRCYARSKWYSQCAAACPGADWAC